MTSPVEFLQPLLLLWRHDEDRALDELYDQIDAALSNSRFQYCMEVLSEVVNRIDEVPTGLLLGFLTITAAAKDELKPSRAKLVTDVRRVLHERGELESGILSGLE